MAKASAVNYRRGKGQAAKKILLSNGTAPRTAQVANILDDMHLNHGVPLVHPETTTEQVQTSAADCRAALAAGKRECSTDVYGWSDYLWAGRVADEKHPLAVQVGRLMEILGRPKGLPLALAFIQTTGALQALNKVEKEKNEARVKGGEPPLIRPVNQGTILTRRVFSVATKSKSAAKVKKAMEPVQMGLGVPGGPETVALTCQGFFKAGCLVGTEDAINGFNAVKRKAVLDAVKARWPQGTDLFNFYYGHPSPAIFVFFFY
jgi:hypothetical protein